ncbi:uroporphyrinogen decarboxylase [Actinomyces graevenitzii]|uniref:uroporphyrinogen decarboxylase n=1 Tax=Actinomyces graevenitzii TaxID=55565 RepID=UPI000C80CB91|nr:uroporphyrinogen decarboxylase [Actinomyces graevenitzii]PMC91386.1 uroporphyrinogen decarboxylase [Actinomyces graevenitzii]
MNALPPPHSPQPALLAALNGQRTARTPVWFMRQAGRSLPEYRQLRAQVNLPMLEACLNPQVVAQATLQPVRRHGVDAAIFFSDIMVPLRLAGVDVEIKPQVGPVLSTPIRTRDDVERLLGCGFGQGTWVSHDGAAHQGAEGVAALREAIALILTELGTPAQAPKPGAPQQGAPQPLAKAQPASPAQAQAAGWTPLIGFGGAPFTLAAYLVEGKPSRDHLAARSLMHADPPTWDLLMRWCAQVTGDFIALQISCGASAAQLFDSWAGSLSPTDYRERVAPYSALAIARAREAISPTTGKAAPLIHFATGSARLLPQMLAAGAQAVGVDDRTELDWAIDQLGGSCPVQGNLNPALLTAPWPVIEQAIVECLRTGRQAPGHVFNLGHGVPPTTDPTVLTRIVEFVHKESL